MLFKSVKMQMEEMFRRKLTLFTFCAVLIFVLINVYKNMMTNYDIGFISQMYDPIRVHTLSDYSISGHFFFEYFPFIVVIPTACTYLNDRNTGNKLYIESRVGKNNYWYGKMISVFIVTFLIFTIPFLLEIIIDCICFDMSSHGDPSGLKYVKSITMDSRYPFAKILANNNILYGVIMILIFGCVSGILAMFNFAVATLPFFKYKIFTFFPIYILVFILSFVERVLNINTTFNYRSMLKMFVISSKIIDYNMYWVLAIALILVSYALIRIKIKRDDII